MRTWMRVTLGAAVLCLASPSGAAGPRIVDDESKSPYRYTGILLANGSQGSGVVARHPRIVLSAAHLTFDGGWQPTGRFSPGWNQYYLPYSSAAVPLGGYYYYKGYSKTARRYGTNHDRAFAYDFTTHWAYEPTAGGGYAGYWLGDGGRNALRSSRYKIIVGYPSELYGNYWMFRTGPFQAKYAVAQGNYLTVRGPTSGSGASGGPVFVKDGSNHYLAGIHVARVRWSNGAVGSGAYAMNDDARKLVKKAIPDQVRPRVTIDNTPTTTSSKAIRLTGDASDDQYVHSVTTRSRRSGGKWSRWKSANVSRFGSSASWKQRISLNEKGNHEIQVRAWDGKNYSGKRRVTVRRR